MRKCFPYNNYHKNQRRLRLCVFFFFFLICFPFRSLWPEEVAISRALTLETCLNIALQNNPQLLSLRRQYEASLARVNMAKAIPQPSLGLDLDLLPGPFSFRRSEETYVGINQTIEFPGRRKLRTRIASLEAEELGTDIENFQLDLIFLVKEAFYRLLLVEEELKYARQNLELSQQFLDITEIKFSAGEVSQSEVLRAKVEVARATNRFKEAETEKALAKARLNTLLGQKSDNILEIQGELRHPFLHLTLAEAREKALRQRPEMRKIEFSLARIQAQKQQAWLGYLPDFSVGLSQHRLESAKYWDFTLSFTLPLFFWQPRRGEVAEAEAIEKSLNQEKAYWLGAIYFEVEEAYLQAKLAEEQIRLFEDSLLSQAQQVYEMFSYRYQEGEISGLELIEARRTWIDSRREYAQTLFRHATSLAALERALGVASGGGR